MISTKIIIELFFFFRILSMCKQQQITNKLYIKPEFIPIITIRLGCITQALYFDVMSRLLNIMHDYISRQPFTLAVCCTMITILFVLHITQKRHRALCKCNSSPQKGLLVSQLKSHCHIRKVLKSLYRTVPL